MIGEVEFYLGNRGVSACFRSHGLLRVRPAAGGGQQHRREDPEARGRLRCQSAHHHGSYRGIPGAEHAQVSTVTAKETAQGRVLGIFFGCSFFCSGIS